ncbi:signal peptide peptidase SppA [Vibrio viridaestus]|uniref:Signal peptide peptidase SppA n=1 Tax=Vibrio viridaestus TaxID=2487322 RepID=A0A3N9THI4_9VIBR|nr:signal peptide peptidase SppA [Vibrio viridaestus]RQW63717.1 signal peptide peptidase SppA [Vibrio viridaestus]
MKPIFRFIGLIFKILWKAINFIRKAFFNLIFLVIIGAIYYAYTDTTSSPEPTLTKSALVLDLEGPIVEQASYASPVESLNHSVLGNSLPKENVLFDIVDKIRAAKDDKNITGLVLSLSKMSETNLTKLRYIAKAINEFKATGKPVIAVGDYYSQSQYYLASYANKVFLSPDGAVLLKGYSTSGMYYKTLLDKLNINTHIFRVGTYKSAVEPFMRTDMSPAAKEANQRWLGQLWNAYINDVTGNRQIEPSTLQFDMNEFLTKLKAVNGNIAQLSLDMGLVDQLVTRPQARQLLAKTFGSDGKDGFEGVSFYDYMGTTQKGTFSGNQIAVVVADGAIMDGDQPRGTVGGDSTAALLRDALNDPRIKAVVLRVDSPGGSAFASQVIRNEILALKKAGKPVVVSMSSLAASGGYWISMSADQIMAQPTTLTGSIGIFSVITTFEKALDNIGISTDGVGTTPFSNQGLASGLSDGAKQSIQMVIEHGYHRFISLVAQSRNMSLDDVDKIAQGHVWTGKDALDLGLVDKLGDFDDAVALAAKLAKIDHYELDWMEKPLSTFEQLMFEFTQSAKASIGFDISSLLPESLQTYAKAVSGNRELIDMLNDPRGQYSLCLTCDVK